MNKLKSKWNIKSNLQFIIILIVFGITGSLSLFVSEPVLNYIGLKKETMNVWIFTPLRIIIIFPIYQILILIVGFIFGEFQFFWNFEKKMFKRLKNLI